MLMVMTDTNACINVTNVMVIVAVDDDALLLDILFDKYIYIFIISYVL